MNQTGVSCIAGTLWNLDHKEGWALKNWCFQIVVLEKTLESPLDCKEIKPVNYKGNQPWIFTGRTDTKAAALILWPLDGKSWFIEKDPDSGKDWGQEEKGETGWNGWIASPTQRTCIWAISSGGSDNKESACNAGDPGLIPGSGRFPGEKKEYPLQYFCLENSMDKGVWQATVHRVTKSWTWLSNWHFPSLHFTSRR